MPYSLRKPDRKLLSFLLLLTISCILVLAVVVARLMVSGQSRQAKAPREAPAFHIALIKLFGFSEENSLKEWEEKIFKGKVVYKIESGKDLSYVRATSKAAASALYYKIKLDARKRHPAISWKWRVEKFPDKKMGETLDKQDEDDFSARVYVIFPALFFTNSKVLEYIWAKELPVGTVGTSPYSKNIKLIVKRSGPANDGEWAFEEADVVGDYIKAFGRTPEYDIGAIAFMTNAEHTATSAEGMYDEISVGYLEDKTGVRDAN